MNRLPSAASAALLVLGAILCAPSAAAAEGDQTIRVQNGEIRCVLSADYEGRGRPMAICGRTNGGPFAVSPSPLNLAVVQAAGEMYFMAGTVPGPETVDVVLGPGQTYRANGWNVRTEELRTLIWNDDGGHGIRVNPVDVAAIWI
ncbi:Uncharacterised protein [Mycolicibacterium aurum]|uniref:Secreted protein n=1 Tax=Mycolicibacterium aurum TaxID=1791 RepID=A0A3S5EK13_MYCAU|nr:hypothetical protein [Mycolicibacterium aurum]VEG58630.1 Uncharacterised protein [Mycolicibacterium aurum]